MEQMPRILDDVFGYYSLVLLGLGARVGLVDAFLSGPGDASEIAGRAHSDPRNTEVWLNALTARGYASHDAGTYAPSDQLVGAFGPGFPLDVRSLVEGALGTSAAWPALERAWRDGSGLTADELRAMSAFAGVNTPMYRQALVPDWVAGVSGLADRLSEGGRIADVGAGNGNAVTVLAEAFPDASVVGYDLRPAEGVALPRNATLREGDARRMVEDGPFDLVVVLDTLHHVAAPESLVADLRPALAPGGVLLVAESAYAGDVDQDAANPFGFVGYASALLYCLQEPLGQGGPAQSCVEDPQWVAEAMSAVGLADVGVRHTESGMAVVTGRA